MENSYSKFWELDQVTETSSDTIVKYTKAHFAKYGISVTRITDNGPQFRAHYDDFIKQWGIKHVTSSSYHSQSNGKEAVKIAKNKKKTC